MDKDLLKLQIAFDLHTEIEGDTPEIIHPEPLLHLILDLPNQALITNDKEIIDLQNDCGYYISILIMEHQQSSVNT